MSKSSDNPSAERRAVSPNDPADDYALWQKLRPYVGHCLTLNHEINNALTGLLGYTEFMLVDRSSLSTDQTEHLENIQTAALKIKAAAEQLSSEKIALSEEIDLRPIIDAYARIAKRSE
jgi:hypothetical protein